MKKNSLIKGTVLLGLIVSLVLTMMLPTTSYAASSTYPAVTTSKVTVRATASSKGKILGYIAKGKQITVTTYNKSWVKLIFNKKTGYIASSYTKKVSIKPATNLTVQQQQRLLAFGAIYPVYNGDNPSVIKYAGDDVASMKRGLSDYWGVTNYASANQIITWLINTGHRTPYDSIYLKIKNNQLTGSEQEEYSSSIDAYNQAVQYIGDDAIAGITKDDLSQVNTIAAWDYSRAVHVIRMSLTCGYITESQAWNYLQRNANAASKTFRSWKSYYISFILGRAIAYEDFDMYYALAGDELLSDSHSLWKVCNISQ